MKTISLCMIVKDEEDTLARCLESVKMLTDEIIIVDTGSKDKTKEIAKEYTDNIYEYEWNDDFSKARNYSLSKATKDYIMWLDADDVIENENLEKLMVLKNELNDDIDIVMLKYNSGFDENNRPYLSYYRERIIKNNKGYKFVDPIHEVIVLSGNIIYKDIAISHRKIHSGDPKRNLKIYNKMIEEGKELNPRQSFYYSRELYYNEEYDRAITEFNKFLESKMGWYENCISACKDLATCYIAKGENRKALNALFKSFEYDKPRAEITCEIAKNFEEQGKYNIAIYWYEVAINSKKDETSGGFYNNDYYDFIPYIGLSVCYYKLGNIEMSYINNENAGKIKPESEIYLNNKEFFENILIKN